MIINRLEIEHNKWEIIYFLIVQNNQCEYSALTNHNYDHFFFQDR